MKRYFENIPRASATVTACAAGSRRDGTREGRDPISPSWRGGGRPKILNSYEDSARIITSVCRQMGLYNRSGNQVSDLAKKRLPWRNSQRHHRYAARVEPFLRGFAICAGSDNSN
jgi:hypothetical protein